MFCRSASWESAIRQSFPELTSSKNLRAGEGSAHGLLSTDPTKRRAAKPMRGAGAKNLALAR